MLTLQIEPLDSTKTYPNERKETPQRWNRGERETFEDGWIRLETYPGLTTPLAVGDPAGARARQVTAVTPASRPLAVEGSKREEGVADRRADPKDGSALLGVSEAYRSSAALLATDGSSER